MKARAIQALVLCALVAVTARQDQPRASAAPARGPNPADYAAALMAQQNGSGAGGAVALLPGLGAVTVAMAVAGLTPNSTYQAQILSGGTCGGQGSVAFHLTALKADSAGEAMAFSTIHSGAVPAVGYFVNVLSTKPKVMPIACGNLKPPDVAVALKAVNGSKVKATALITLHAPVAGATTQLGTQVLVYATGLQPKTPQANHIHAGLCGKPSPVSYPLLTLVPDAQGRAVAGTGITDIVPTTGVSIHIHDNTFKTVACGDLSP